jgi:hypothetical protein
MREPTNLGAGFTLTPLATAWADAEFRCHDCDERIRQSHPSLRSFLHRFH